MKIKIILILIALMLLVPFSMKIFENVVYANEYTLDENKVPGIYYTRKGGGEYVSDNFTEYTINGDVVFCIEPGVLVTTHNYSGSFGFVNSPYDYETNHAIELIGHYGYSYPGHQTREFRMATQSLIWERVSGKSVEYWTLPNENGTHIDISYEKNIILDLVSKNDVKPSFNNTQISGIVGSKTVLTDTNNVLSGYEIYSVSGGTASINGNNLEIIPTITGEVNVNLIRSNYDTETTIIFKSVDLRSQTLAFFRLSDPVVSNVRLNVEGGNLTINKLDKDTQSNKAQGEGTLQGAVYGVYDLTGNLIKELTTNESATANTGKILNIGTYYLKEITPSTGYLLDDNKYYFHITNENLNPVLNVYEDIIKRDVEINKFYANGETGMLKPEVGIIFEVYNNKNELVTEFTTDENGYSKLNLVYGNYTIKQKTTTNGHEKVDDFNITINNDSPTTIKYSLSNAPITAKLKLQKIDSESGKVIAYAGVTFKIKDLSTNEYISQTISYPEKQEITEFSTNAEGEFTTPYPLTTGTYQLEEVSSPIGYLLSGNHVIFTIDDNSEILEYNFGKYLEIIFKNNKIKGQVTINKTGENPIFNENTVEYENIILEGVKFGIYANEDIVTLDGVTHYLKDELVSEITTDSQGMAILKDMILGKYYIKEIATLPNYVLDTNIYEFELTEVDNQTSIVYETIELENEYKKGILELTKTDFVTGEVIPNTIIEIYNMDDELLFIKTTDENGKVIIEELPVGKYYIKEYEAATGYLITEEIVEFEIKENGEIIKATMTNKPITGTLEFSKIDFSTSDPLPNTVIEIYNDNEELVYTGTTDENGMIVIEQLRYGRYYILEKEAPEGYILNTERMYFEILENNEIVKATMTNEKIVIEVPDTELNKLPIIEIISGILIITGIGVIIYGTKKSKTEKKK